MKKIFILILLFSCASYSYSQKVIPGQINREDLLKGIDNASQVLDKSLLMDAVSSAFGTGQHMGGIIPLCNLR